jgi:hypothetical protein
MIDATHRAFSKMLILVLWSICLYLLLFWMVQAPAQSLAQGGPTTQDLPGRVRVLPNPAMVQVSQRVTIEVWLEDAGNYYGIDIRFSFDPNHVRVPAGQVAPLWEVIDRNNHFIIRNEVDNTRGTIWYAVTNINPAEPFTGTGRLCTVVFSGVEAGTSELHFTYAKGSTREGVSLYPETVDGTIVVQQPLHFELYLPFMVRSFREEM